MRSMIKGLLSIIAFFILTFQVFAQDEVIDSLKNKLNEVKSDTSRVNTLNEISYNLFLIDPEQSLDYGIKAKELAEQIGYTKGLAYANKNIGLSYYMQSNFVEVLTYWEASLKALQEINDQSGVANLLSNIGVVYYAFGDEATALDYHYRSLRIAEEIKDNYRIFSSLVNLGSIYDTKKETYAEALINYEKALLFLEYANSKNDRGTLLSNLGELFINMEIYDSAHLYLDKALIEFKGSANYPIALNLKGKLFMKQSEIEKAIQFQKQAIDISTETENKSALTESFIGLGNTYLKINDYPSALEVFMKAENLANEVGTPEYIQNVHGGLATAYMGLKDYRKAFLHKELYSHWKDTIYNAEVNDKIKGLQFNYQMEKKQDEINLLAAANEIEQLKTKRQTAISWGAGIVGVLLLILAVGIFRRYKFVRKIKGILEKEKDRSDNLLLNILPAETAEELKEKGEAEAKYYESATILFTDFIGFTTISATMTPGELVKNLHECFKMFDIIITRHGLEKIKTIGDAYMAAGGLPKMNNTHPYDVANAALEIRAYMEKFKATRIEQGRPYFEIRIGIHTGPVVSGIVGIKKFAYDIWGDTVNVAARMESNSEAGKINISEHTYELLKEKFNCSYRGEIEAKNRGKLKMYFLENSYDEVLTSDFDNDEEMAGIKMFH